MNIYKIHEFVLLRKWWIMYVISSEMLTTETHLVVEKHAHEHDHRPHGGPPRYLRGKKKVTLRFSHLGGDLLSFPKYIIVALLS